MRVAQVVLLAFVGFACASPPPATPTAQALLEFPADSAVALEVGRYSSQPPFDLPFNFEIPVQGWGTAHHHGEFFDVIQPVALGVSPTRWIAFARPHVMHGSEDIDAAGLSPSEIVAAFEGRGDIEVGEARPYVLAGIDGLVVDVSTRRADVKPFGGPAGDLQLDPAYETRMVIVPVAGAPLLVIVFGPRGELEPAWADSQPIVDSITW